MDLENQLMNDSDQVFCLEDIFFIKSEAIRKNDYLVQKTFEDVFKQVNYN